MRPHRPSWKTLVLSASTAIAQQITAFNRTSENDAFFNGTQLNLGVSVGERAMSLIARILPLTQAAGTQIPASGIFGPVFLATPYVQSDIESSNIVLISCDASDYTGNIDARGLFGAAQTRNASSVIFFSRQDAACNLTDYNSSYQWVYTTQSSSDALKLLQHVNTSSIRTTYIGIGPSSTYSPTNPSTTSQSSPGNTPGTTVAMIVLYSITGVITALFLIIIVTGAVRAHRHPERYGPRPALGASRQSRAKGLAKAMLESLPIVKFSGERQDTKNLDHELESGRNLSASPSHNPHPTTPSQPHEQPTTLPNTAPEHAANSDGIAIVPREGLGAATLSPHTDSADVQGCSICTEDFEHGQDQRVLPCDHRFHPACVDPWLLNVSATCPLCRIDLRPPQSGAEGETSATGDSQTLPPPLGVDATSGASPEDLERERGSRRSYLRAILGVHRPEGMSREQRIEALRAYQQRLRRLSRR